jgi:hypothetical protein
VQPEPRIEEPKEMQVEEVVQPNSKQISVKQKKSNFMVVEEQSVVEQVEDDQDKCEFNFD